MNEAVFSVSDLLALAKGILEEATGPVWVAGEITGFKRHASSGHLYFDLKDPRARLACVQWRDRARRLRFEPSDGMLVRAYGRLGIYEVQGRLQLYVETLEPAGVGELQAALERLKIRLAAEGLFDPARKRPLPAYPRTIGVATSSSGAALRDVLRVLRERWPIAEVCMRACAVQGEGAAEEVIAALAELERVAGLDLILLVRGGGSIEDLWTFNEEKVVRAVASCSIPVVTGIGHEIDVTLVDFAADLRAATPSQAAELAVPSRLDVARVLRGHGQRVRALAEGKVRVARLRLQRIEGSHGLRRPADLIRTRIQRLDEMGQRISGSAARRLENRRQLMRELLVRFRARDPRLVLRQARMRLADLAPRCDRAARSRWQAAQERLRARGAHLEAVGPRAVLARGYAICLKASDRRAVRSFEEVGEGERVEVILGAGGLGCVVEERRERWPAAAGSADASREGMR